jgi:hypothetical protein
LGNAWLQRPRLFLSPHLGALTHGALVRGHRRLVPGTRCWVAWCCACSRMNLTSGLLQTRQQHGCDAVRGPDAVLAMLHNVQKNWSRSRLYASAESPLLLCQMPCSRSLVKKARQQLPQRAGPESYARPCINGASRHSTNTHQVLRSQLSARITNSHPYSSIKRCYHQSTTLIGCPQSHHASIPCSTSWHCKLDC